MRTKSNKTEQISKEIKKLKKELDKEFEKALTEMIFSFFKAHPQVMAFRWKAYVPYFNDGDACYFTYESLLYHAVDVEINGKIIEQEPELDDDDDDDDDSWFSTTAEGKAALADLVKIDDFLEKFTEPLESLFGNNSAVEATALGLHFEEYDDHE